MQKHRVSYILGDARFDFDKYGGDYGYIPEFMEIEAKSIDCNLQICYIFGF